MTRYTEVCEAKTPEEMRARFDDVLSQIVAKHGGTKESHRETQLSNVGYFSGYYGPEVYAHVHEWLGATHPIFGATYPKAEDALAAGMAAGALHVQVNAEEK